MDARNMAKLAWWMIGQYLKKEDEWENLRTDLEADFERWGFLNSPAKQKRFSAVIGRIQEECRGRGMPSPDELKVNETELDQFEPEEMVEISQWSAWIDEQKEKYG
jgi:hypothetical protein